jgi:hypothetical protein
MKSSAPSLRGDPRNPQVVRDRIDWATLDAVSKPIKRISRRARGERGEDFLAFLGLPEWITEGVRVVRRSMRRSIGGVSTDGRAPALGPAFAMEQGSGKHNPGVLICGLRLPLPCSIASAKRWRDRINKPYSLRPLRARISSPVTNY